MYKILPWRFRAVFPNAKSAYKIQLASGGPKGGHLEGGHLKMGVCSGVRTRQWDFALQFALDTSILTALSKGIPQGRRRLEGARRRLDQKGAV